MGAIYAFSLGGINCPLDCSLTGHRLVRVWPGRESFCPPKMNRILDLAELLIK